MNTNDDLKRAVADFRAIESQLAELAHQTEAVAGAGRRLASTEEALRAIQALVTEALGQHATLAEQLASLAGDLAESTEVVRKGDPSKMFEAVERLTADFERQKERISEMAGEIRVRIEQATRAIDVSVANSAEEIATALGQQGAAIADSIGHSRADLGDALRESREALTAAVEAHDKSTDTHIAEVGRRLWLPAIAAAVLSGIAVVLLIVVLIAT